jgi:DNA-binding Lrp family transcriptional regulator
MIFSEIESKILNRIQKDFPLTEDPFADMAKELSIEEEEFLTVAKKLKEDGVVRNISGIFNPKRLGYISNLIAFKVNNDNIENAASIISSHPGVSHNYQREHEYNIWFTLAADSESKLELTVKILAGKCGVSDYLILRNEKMLKIGLLLDIGNDSSSEENSNEGLFSAKNSNEVKLSEDEMATVRILQMDLPIEKNPFALLLEKSNNSIDIKTLMEDSLRFKNEGVLRRYSAVLRHTQAGYKANAMTVWKPGINDDMERVGKIFFDTRAISHLYLRTIYPGRWEYPLFAMIHAKTSEELESIISELSEKSGITDYQSLRSVKEFKKERVVYCSDKFNNWEKQAGL